MSDVTSPARRAPEPVIQPLGAEFLPAGHPPSVEKQDDWMLPPPSKFKDKPSPAADGFSKVYPSSPFNKDIHNDEYGLGNFRKYPDSSVTEIVAPSASKPTNSTMAYALFSNADAAKESGKNSNVTAHIRVSSQPESFATPSRPPSTRPTQTWSSGPPIQSTTYQTNIPTSSRNRGRSKLPEPEAFLDPVQSRTAASSSHPSDQAYRRPASNVPSEESILKTPSSLAPSMLKPTASRTSIPASTISQQDSRKKGLFGMFKSKSSSTQATAENPYEVWNPPTASEDVRKNTAAIPTAGGKPVEARASLSKSFFKSKGQAPTATDTVYEVWNPSLPHDRAKIATTVDAGMNASFSDLKPSSISRSKVPPPITVPISIPTVSERKSPNHKVFTPFRYLTTKRNRTMSAASVEAVDGTAPNTVVGSPTASMNSSQPPIQPPPMRDTQQATHEWRERKESETRNNRYRVLRPGVVFDVPQDPHQDKQNLRYVKTSRSARASNAR
ncbi:hypothetical protein F5051DRAFT_390717 [Lentinula edodes]|nr:hypothetical protein F5051DRAFT_390717 [Lentinula edodes]